MSGRTFRGTLVVATSLLVLVSLALPAGAAEATRGAVLGLRELDESGSPLQGFYLGYRFGRWIPVMGYDRLHIGGELTTTTQQVGSGETRYTLAFSGTAHMPWGGLKYFYKAPGVGKAAPYAMVVVGKPLVGVRLDLSGSVTEQERDQLEDLERQINDSLPSLWLLQGAVGGEYFVADSFAIAGEAGVRVVMGSASYASDIAPDVTQRASVSTFLDYTFVSLGITYYF